MGDRVHKFSRAIGALLVAASLAGCSGAGSSASGALTIPGTATAPQSSGTSPQSVTTQSVSENAALTTSALHQCVGRRQNCIAHVLLISIDGMHAVDLANFVASHPKSALASLSQTGVTYANAHTTGPSDSFPGLLALTTGGNPASTGVYYEVSYDRSLFPPNSNCTGQPGTVVAMDESIDIDSTKIDGGGGIAPTKLTQQRIAGTCTPVFPHNYLRVNTIFEAVKEHGGRTAWSDKEQSYEMLNGPSGKGVDDLFNLEIAANGTTSSISATEAYDDLKVRAMINEIDGKTSRGVSGVPVPTLFGMNFQGVSVGQKLANAEFGVGPRGGYTDAIGTPTPLLEGALEHTDASIGLMLAELAKQGLAQSTMVVISAKHGQAPINIALRRGIGGAAASFGAQLANNNLGFVQTDDLALIWLKDRSEQNERAATANLRAGTFPTDLGFESGHLFTADSPPPGYGREDDPRTPDFSVQVDPGVIYTTGTKIAEHGGFSDDDTHVALLVSSPTQRPHIVTQTVHNTQVAPTILEALGIDGERLQAVQREGTRELPDLNL